MTILSASTIKMEVYTRITYLLCKTETHCDLNGM